MATIILSPVEVTPAPHARCSLTSLGGLVVKGSTNGRKTRRGTGSSGNFHTIVNPSAVFSCSDGRLTFQGADNTHMTVSLDRGAQVIAAWDHDGKPVQVAFA